MHTFTQLVIPQIMCCVRHAASHAALLLLVSSSSVCGCELSQWCFKKEERVLSKFRLTSLSLSTNHTQALRQGGTGECNNAELGQEGRGHGMERGSVFPSR
jgi:hypothetical protein